MRPVCIILWGWSEMVDPQNNTSAQTAPNAEEVKARNSRNLWLGLALAAFVVIVGVITFVRLSSSDLSKSGFYYEGPGGGSASETEGALPAGMTQDQAAPPPNLSRMEDGNGDGSDEAQP